MHDVVAYFKAIACSSPSPLSAETRRMRRHWRFRFTFFLTRPRRSLSNVITREAWLLGRCTWSKGQSSFQSRRALSLKLIPRSSRSKSNSIAKGCHRLVAFLHNTLTLRSESEQQHNCPSHPWYIIREELMLILKNLFVNPRHFFFLFPACFIKNVIR